MKQIPKHEIRESHIKSLFDSLREFLAFDVGYLVQMAGRLKDLEIIMAEHGTLTDGQYKELQTLFNDWTDV